MARWELYGQTMEQAITNARLVRRIAIGAVAVFIYWRLAAPIASLKWLHVTAAFIVVQILDILLAALLFGTPSNELLNLGPLGRGALSAFLGWSLAALGSNNPSKPPPLRGAS